MANTPNSKRVKRTPVGGPRDVLTVSGKDPNYAYRWVLDVPGRIQRFKDGGYEVVTDGLEVGQATVDRGSNVGSGVTKSAGAGQTLVLMRIPMEYYKEDQDAKQAEITALEASMKKEAHEGRYGSLTISRDK
jgi:hypothetical protein